MKVRIVRQPSGTLEGLALHYYREGQVYDLPATLAVYLVVEGFARIEMRREQAPTPPEFERRHRPALTRLRTLTPRTVR